MRTNLKMYFLASSSNDGRQIVKFNRIKNER